MTDTIAARLRRLASPRRHGPLGSPSRRAAALLLRLGCVALLGWIGYIHLHLWLEGYRQIPTDGPLFLVDAVAGFALAVGLLVWPAPLAGLLAAGYTAATLGALLLSLTVGLFGFRESISASYVAQSLTIEPITILALLAWAVLVTAAPRPPDRPPTGAGPSQKRRTPTRHNTSRPPDAGSRRLVPWTLPTRNSAVSEPQINVDHFYRRPIFHLVGLLTDKSEIPAISRQLESAGINLAAVEILCGEHGAAILDEHGRYHGLRGRIVRAFQRFGYDGMTLEIYDEALRDGDLLLQVPVRPAERRHIAALLQHHDVHDVGYFGPGTFEEFPTLGRDFLEAPEAETEEPR